MILISILELTKRGSLISEVVDIWLVFRHGSSRYVDLILDFVLTLTLVNKHYGPQSWNKNWIYRADDWLWATRWEHLIQQRDKVTFAQVISWNDYSESHYVGAIDGVQPNSQGWVNGFDHQGTLVQDSMLCIVSSGLTQGGWI